jgi:hypothetical protein
MSKVIMENGKMWVRFIPFAALLFTEFAFAVTVVDVSISKGDTHAYRTHYDLTPARHSIDLRDSHPYHVAVRDKVRGRDICRESDYRTGLHLTFRDTGEGTEAAYSMEVIGQVSSLGSITPGETLSCGQNSEVLMNNKAFSDTFQIQPGTPKAIVIDNTWTVFFTIKE